MGTKIGFCLHLVVWLLIMRFIRVYNMRNILVWVVSAVGWAVLWISVAGGLATIWFIVGLLLGEAIIFSLFLVKVTHNKNRSNK